MILLDTHALLWWVLDPEQLSATATAVVAEMEERGGFASAISIWELGIKAKRGRIELPITIDELARRVEIGAVVELLPVDTTTWLRSVSLQWEHRDPADRVIVATALIKELPLLTKDATLHAFEGVECRW